MDPNRARIRIRTASSGVYEVGHYIADLEVLHGDQLPRRNNIKYLPSLPRMLPSGWIKTDEDYKRTHVHIE